MTDIKHNLKQFINATNGRAVLVDPLSISSIVQVDNGTIRITLKEIKDGQNVSFTANYDMKAVHDILNS